MDKRNKKSERPKLRKEDIGTPVNFVHVQHVGFGVGQRPPPVSTQSACTSPTFENMDSFFNQENYRRSGKFNPGKENRFSNNSSDPPPPYSSMSNLSMVGNSYEKELDTQAGPLKKFAGVGKQKSAKSGSLLNLNFFPFSKSSSVNVQERSASIRGGSKSEHDSSTIRTKRLSLGVGFPMSSSSSSSGGGGHFSFLPTRPLTGPPETPSPITDDEASSGQQRPQVRRRSSSFNGESDAVCYSEIMGSSQTTPTNCNPLMPPSLTLNRHMGISNNKKQKMGSSQPHSLPSSSPLPLSPDYEELPPPPDMSSSSNESTTMMSHNDIELPPESPSYVELPPPPPMNEIFPLRKMSLEFSYPQQQQQQQPPTLPTNPPNMNMRRRLSAIPATPNGDMPFLPPPPSPQLSPPSTPPPLPTSPPPSLNTTYNNKSRVGYNLAPLRAKLVRVNAPTLPPLSVPFIRPKSQSPVATPSTWPLEPGMPELYQSTSGNAVADIQQESCQKTEERLNDTGTTDNETTEDMNLSIERIQEACNHNSTSIDSSHIEPLSKLFQCRLAYHQWPTMMKKLFENISKNEAGEQILSQDKAFAQVYNELIQNTLELWLRLEGGQSTLENVVTAFEQTQIDLSQDCTENVTKL